MTLTSTLTDRYIAQALRGIPAKQRADIDVELRGLIADSIEDRLAQGEDAATAEREVLGALGAPARLAASYTDRPLVLIGGDLYLDYVRTLTVLLSTVVPLWLLFMGIVTFVDGATALNAVGAAVWAAIEIGITITFFTTAVFAIIERSPALRARRSRVWDPSSLPAVAEKRGYWGELIGGSIFLVVVASGLILGQTVAAVEGPDGTRIGPISAELWASGIFTVALLFAVVSISFHVFAWYTGWSVSNAVATIILGVLFVVPVVWITASGRLLSRDYFVTIGWPEGVQIVTTVVIVVVVLLAVMDSVDGLVRASRSRRTR